MRKIKYLGGIGAKWTETRYRQGNKIYSSDGIAATVISSSVGNIGGMSSMYIVKRYDNEEE